MENTEKQAPENCPNATGTCGQHPLRVPTKVPTAERLTYLEHAAFAMAEEIDQPITYFIKSGDYVKIGYSRTAAGLRKRLINCRMYCPEGAILIGVSPGGEETERLLHKRLRRSRVQGEWFRLDNRTLGAIRYEGMWKSWDMHDWPFYPLYRKTPVVMLPSYTS